MAGASLVGFGGKRGGVVVGQHEAVGVVDDLTSTAVVGEERNGDCVFGEILREVDEVFHVGTGKAVDGLPVVAYSKEFELGIEGAKSLNKAEKGHFTKAGVAMKKHLKEFRLDDAANMNVGDIIAADVFAAGDRVDVTGITKGRGYSGVIKRWGCHKLRMTHGVGPVHRQPGSMGANSSPSRIFKNKKMAGQYGNEQVTVLNLDVVRVDADKNLIAVKGAVPGAKGGIVFIRNTVKA